MTTLLFNRIFTLCTRNFFRPPVFFNFFGKQPYCKNQSTDHDVNEAEKTTLYLEANKELLTPKLKDDHSGIIPKMICVQNLMAADNKSLEAMAADDKSAAAMAADNKPVKGLAADDKPAEAKKPPQGVCLRKKVLYGGTSDDGSSPKRVRPIEPGEVVLGLIPVEWVNFLVPKTGHTGFWTLIVTLSTYLISKEFYVLDHEYYNGLSFILFWYLAIRMMGKDLAKSLDDDIEEYEKKWHEVREQQKEEYANAIKYEVEQQYVSDGQNILIQAKRENVGLQLEGEFRRRQMRVYEEVKRYLDYQVAMVQARKHFMHKNLVAWVRKEVEKSLTPELKDAYLKLCLEDIKNLFKESAGPKTGDKK